MPSARTITAVIVPLAVAAMGSACGTNSVGSTAAPTPTGSGDATTGKPHATLAVAGAGTRPASACGSQKTFVVVPAPAAASVTGRITPAPPAGTIVRVKAKMCVGATWQTANEQHFKLAHQGHFAGAIPLPGRGSYTIRAYFSTGASTIESTKSYVVVQ